MSKAKSIAIGIAVIVIGIMVYPWYSANIWPFLQDLLNQALWRQEPYEVWFIKIIPFVVFIAILVVGGLFLIGKATKQNQGKER